MALTLLCGAALAGVLLARPSARAQEATSRTVPRPTPEGTSEDANSCGMSEEASYPTPTPEGP